MSAVAASTLQVAIVADLLEERWPSMDLVADMLMEHAADEETGIRPILVRPAFAPKLPMWARRGAGQVPTIERIAHRFWSYPRWLGQQLGQGPLADVFHIVDHSYAHIAESLPAGRVVITCHDIDAFRALLAADERESQLPRFLVQRVMDGFRSAAAVICDSEATRAEVIAHSLVPAERTSVVPIGVHPSCTPTADAVADTIAAKLTGETGPADILHVGSTIPRKQIDVLLEIFAIVASANPGAKLWRAGGPFTPEQAERVERLGLADRITVLPFMTRAVLAAVYRRAALVLLPSIREGFGLPVVEAMACGTPIVCSDLPVLREVGGTAADYCRPGDPGAWAARVNALLGERSGHHGSWAVRKTAGIARASVFTWERYAAEMRNAYRNVAMAAAR